MTNNGDDRAIPVDVEQLTSALDQARRGDRRRLDVMIPVVYDELRRIAGAAMRREGADHTLQATAVANEAYLNLLDQRNLDVANRPLFLATAATMIRRILIDHARGRLAQKRGGAADRLTLSGLDVAAGSAGATGVDLLDLETALESLAKMDERMAKVVELKFFGGLTTPEAAEALGVSPRTVADDWAFARAWLARALGDGGDGGGGNAARASAKRPASR